MGETQPLKLLANPSSWPTDLAVYIRQSRRHCIPFDPLIFQGIVLPFLRNDCKLCVLFLLPSHKSWSTVTSAPIVPNFLKWGPLIKSLLGIFGFRDETQPLKLLANPPLWPTDLVEDICQSQSGCIPFYPQICLCMVLHLQRDECMTFAFFWLPSCKC